MNSPEGAWIFLSHSTQDWHEVRRVRNLLEERGHKPLVFFLKCLSEPTELLDILKREIEARTWFLLCDSENARRSVFVREEVYYIKSLAGKHYEQINLHQPIETQIERIDRLCRRASVFISYSSKDRDYAHRIQNSLSSYDFRVWWDGTILPGADFTEVIDRALFDAAETGWVVALISSNFLQSRFCMSEISRAVKQASSSVRGMSLVPVFLEDPSAIIGSAPLSFRTLLEKYSWYDFSRGSFDDNITGLVGDLLSRRMD